MVIARPGFEGAIDESAHHPVPAAYFELNSLDHRVSQADQVISFCCGNILKKPPRSVIVYGHSEGASVAAKLGTVNHRITHVGFWCGNALPDYFDFTLMKRREVLEGKTRDADAQKEIDHLLLEYQEIFRAPQDTARRNPEEPYTNKRWASYAEPPINFLSRIEVPLFVQVATLDENAPVESSFLILLEFTRLGKRNLTFRVGTGWDHGLNGTDAGGNTTGHWDEVFQEFIKWTETPEAGSR